MKNLYVNVSRETRMVDLPKQFIAVDGENLQSKLVFTFIDEFVNGQARLEYEIKGNKNYMLLDKESETYTIPVKNVITKEGQIDMQLVITEGTDEEEIPVFKSNKFYLFCNSSINAVNEAPDGYELWIEKANAKLNEIDNLDILSEKIDKTAIITITRKDGTEEIIEIYDGDDYVLTEEDKEEIVDIVKPIVETDIQPILENIENVANQAELIAKGASQTLNYLDYQDMVTNFNAFDKNKFSAGRNIMIKKLNVPDMWIYELSEEYVEYTYTTDEDLISLLLSSTGLQVGYYILSALETQKVDLTDYAKKEQFVTLLNEKEYEDLSTNGTVTREDGTTLVFSANTYYFIPEQEE